MDSQKRKIPTLEDLRAERDKLFFRAMNLPVWTRDRRRYDRIVRAIKFLEKDGGSDGKL